METEITDVDTSIDIDLIKDEQNPMYQNFDIQRQRLISVLDRAIEKIGIAYVLDELMTKNMSLLHQYMTPQEVETILNIFQNIRRLEEIQGKSSLIRKSTLFKNQSSNKSIDASFLMKSNMSFGTSSIAKSSTVSISPSSHEQEKQILQHAQLIRNYYSSIIAKLHYIPEITYLAKFMMYKKPLWSIKYYIYLKDLRDHVVQMLYQTKTDELNYNKSIKRAYVKNIKEKSQAEAVKKILQDKQKEKVDLELQIKNEIENEKIIQAEMNLQLLSNATGMINKSEEKILARTNKHNMTQEENKVTFAERTACYNKQLEENIMSVQTLRKTVKKLEVTFKKILENYDSTIGKLHEEFEKINDDFLNIESLYNELKKKFDIQEEQYVVVMAEKKEYVEITFLRIRYNRAAKIVQRWWREILVKRWKWRKTYLATQLNRKSLSPAQRAKMRKILKKIKKNQKKINQRRF